jgi:hypothetical protein
VLRLAQASRAQGEELINGIVLSEQTTSRGRTRQVRMPISNLSSTKKRTTTVAPCTISQEARQKKKAPKPAADTLYEVEAIIGHKNVGRGYQYLIKWKASDAEKYADTWASAASLHAELVKKAQGL